VQADAVLYGGRIREVSFVPAGADESTSVVAFSFDESDLPPASLESIMTDEALDALKAEHSALKLQLAQAVADHQREINDLTARLSAVTDQAKAEAEQVQALTAELSGLKAERRTDEVKALFSDLERDFSEEAARPYLEMSAATFELFCSEMRALKAPVELKADYFKDTTPKGKAVGTENVVDLGAQLFKQVAGRT
jgi:undecaprenyl pyrophosphate synthase